MYRHAAWLFFCSLLLAAPAPTPRPTCGKAPMGLYSDAEMERLARQKFGGLEPNGDVFLDVVPNGESRPRGEVFKALGVDESRLRDRSSFAKYRVTTLYWQASPSYNLSFMTARYDRAKKGLDLFDPKQEVYGVRLEKR